MERSLSREEKEELVRSKKKVKAVNHAGFCDGHSSGPSSPNHDGGQWNLNVSFKDRLVGEIPGAFSQAFSFEDGMDDDAESDEEVETLRQGLVSVKLSREFKRKIRKPWGRAFIVKVFGRSVGLHFMQAKLLALWKPVGRLDCVNLGHGFFLTRLSLGEDYENVLRKGPWFFGDHFLSIRPWEPDFKPALASVSSIAVWVRLNELPIEYYNAEALQIIGNAIGKVLRVDTFTVSETRGRFARLCVQVDVEKPLATAIMIGRLEQQICYEGIHKMCFGCGRIGHRKEQCPHIIRQDPPVSEVGEKKSGDTAAKSCSAHDSDIARSGVGTSSDVASAGHCAEQDVVHEGVYGPWVVVTRRKNGTKQLKSSGASPKQSAGVSFKDNGFVEKGGLDRAGGFHGPLRDAKRKMSPPLFIDKAHFESAVQCLRSEGPELAQSSPIRDFNIGGNDIPTRSKTIPNSQRLASVKGKKGAARNRSFVGDCIGAAGEDQRRPPEASTSEVVIFNAATGSSGGNHGWASSKSKPRQVFRQTQKSNEAAITGPGLDSSDGMLCEASESPGSLAETGGGAESFCHDEVQFNHSVGGVLSKSSGCHPSISIPSSGDGDLTAPELSVCMDRPDGMVLEGGGEIEEPLC